MGLAYTIKSAKDKGRGAAVQKPKKKREPSKPRLKLLRDETGAIIRVPKLRPHQDRKAKDRWSEAPCLEGEPAYWGGISRGDLERIQVLLDPMGSLMAPRINLKWGDNERDASRKFWSGVMTSLPVKKRVRTRRQLYLRRNGAVTPVPWATARGDAGALEEQAAHYVRNFDHKNAQTFDEPEFALLKVACNLRHYFCMSQEQTVMLMVNLFNPNTDLPWSREGIALAWELVTDYTPWLGLNDPVAVAEQKRRDLDDAVTEVLAYTRAGERVTTEDFYRLFKKWNPDLNVKKASVTQSVKRITSIEATGYREGKCFPGFHLPTAAELMDTQHHAGLDVGAIEMPQRPVQVVPLVPLLSLVNVFPRAS